MSSDVTEGHKGFRGPKEMIVGEGIDHLDRPSKEWPVLLSY